MTAAEDKRPQINLALEYPRTLSDIKEWVRIAETEGFELNSRVAAQYEELTVSRWVEP